MPRSCLKQVVQTLLWTMLCDINFCFNLLYEVVLPADRLLIATAFELACPLVSYEERVARFAKKYGRRHRFTVVT